MGIVNMLKFDGQSGAMICDEEATYFERRRTHFDENIRTLLTPFVADRFRLEAVYGGAGYPPFHYEVFRRASAELKTWAVQTKKARLEDIARLVLSNFQQTIRRRVDDKLKLFFRFSADDLNRGFFKKGDEEIKITQEKVKKKALDIINSDDKSPAVSNIFRNSAVVMGYDAKHGFRAYNLNGKLTVMSFLTGFETVGNGKYGAGISFAQTFKNRFLSERREGFDPVEGMILLLTSAVFAREYFIDIGGYYSLSYIDGKGKSHRERCREFAPHKTKLAEEIVFANIKGIISREDCRELIRDTLFENKPFDELEEEFFKRAGDEELLEYCLRGYKIDPQNLRPLEKELITVEVKGGPKTKTAAKSKKGGKK